MREVNNYIYQTGESYITGDRLLNVQQNKESTVFNGYFTAGENELTGHYSLRLSADGLTLFEEYPNVFNISGQDFYYINTGDFYVTTDFDNSYSVFLKQTQKFNGTRAIYKRKTYDTGALVLQSSTGVDLWENSTLPNLISELSGEPSPPIDNEDLYDRWDVFFEGYKTSFNDLSYNDSLTGRAFAYKKRENVEELEFGFYDLYGQTVVPKSVEIYVGGLQKSKDSILELYSGIDSIKTGIDSSVIIETGVYNKF